MLRSIIISPDTELAEALQTAITTTKDVEIVRVIDKYPATVDLARTLRAQGPDVIFLSFAAPEKALELVKFLEAEAQGVQIVGIHTECDAKVLRETMRAGVREFLALPFETAAVMETLRNVKELLERNPRQHGLTNQIFAFLPSKAGVGASTLALNVGAAMARRCDDRVMLSDFDLNSGMMRFMLKLQNEYCVLDSLEHTAHMDENLWPQLVTTFDKLDVLHAGRINPNLRIDPGQIRGLTAFLRRNYGALCFDLSGNLERYSLEIMEECRRVMLVCTPEIPSLHLAREKLAFLRQVELDSRVAVVLNRCLKKALLTKEQVEDVLGVPVVRMFSNDYAAVTKSLTAGRWLDPGTDLGKQFDEFAVDLLGKVQGPVAPPRRKFLEYFNVGESALAKTTK